MPWLLDTIFTTTPLLVEKRLELLSRLLTVTTPGSTRRQDLMVNPPSWELIWRSSSEVSKLCHIHYFFFFPEALNRWYTNNNKTLPSRLFLYRDGAGDGQIPHIRDQEVPKHNVLLLKILTSGCTCSEGLQRCLRQSRSAKPQDSTRLLRGHQEVQHACVPQSAWRTR